MKMKMKMNFPNRILNPVFVFVCCLILMPYANANGLPEKGHYNFTTVSDGGLENGVQHLWIMTGRGKFGENHVNGGGEFNHIDGNSAPPPLNVLASGTWKAKEFIDWLPVAGPGPNPHGQAIAGILIMGIRLLPDGNDGDGIPATLTVVCNVPPAGNFTGMDEGIFLNIDGGLSIIPLGVGVTLLTVGKDGQ